MIGKWLTVLQTGQPGAEEASAGRFSKGVAFRQVSGHMSAGSTGVRSRAEAGVVAGSSTVQKPKGSPAQGDGYQSTSWGKCCFH